jgi:polysaccharide export outer membrane protein
MNLKHFKKLTLILVSIIFGWSCTSYKDVPYFQDLRKDDVVNQEIKNYSPLTIQKGDILQIHVTSLNPEADVAFNYDLNLNLTKSDLISNAGNSRPANADIASHLVDPDGNISLPVLGTVKVAGLTTNDLIKDLQTRLQNFFSKPIVTVLIANFKISVLGDVKAPGTYDVQDEKITLIQALSLAGDLNATGIRRDVLLVREVDGVRDYIHIDLTSKDIFNSPYFYLKNNDVLYVQPNRVKATADNTAIEKISVVISALSIIVYLIKYK